MPPYIVCLEKRPQLLKINSKQIDLECIIYETNLGQHFAEIYLHKQNKNILTVLPTQKHLSLIYKNNKL